MASLNTAARELVLKIVYYGPGLGGKTTSLQALHDAAPAERRGKLVSLATPVDRTLYFDFLPLRLPAVRGLGVRLQLFTVPGQVYFNATRRLVLSGADGVVFVADSQADRADSNHESLENLCDNLAEHGRDLATLPHAFAYNKRDLADVLSLEELDAQLNRHRAPSFGTAATRGDGVQETLATITKLVLDAYEAQLPEPSPSHRAISFNSEEPAVSVSGDGGPSAAGSAPEPDVVTSAIDPSRAPIVDNDLETSAPVSRRVVPDVSAIEAAAAAEVTEPSPKSGGLSFSPLFAPGERPLIEQIEQAIARSAHADALAMCDAAITQLLQSVATIVAHEGHRTSAHDPALPLLLGLDGRRYLAFRALARRARHVGDLGVREALESYAFVLEARVAFGQWDALRSAVGAQSVPPTPRHTMPPPSGLPPLPRGSISPPAPESR